MRLVLFAWVPPTAPLFKVSLCLVECKIFSECEIFSGENIFGKGKYFQVFGCVAENALENPFLSCFPHFLRIQTNIITENQNI